MLHAPILEADVLVSDLPELLRKEAIIFVLNVPVLLLLIFDAFADDEAEELAKFDFPGSSKNKTRAEYTDCGRGARDIGVKFCV